LMSILSFVAGNFLHNWVRSTYWH